MLHFAARGKKAPPPDAPFCRAVRKQQTHTSMHKKDQPTI
jgi:hypothetical protein